MSLPPLSQCRSPPTTARSIFSKPATSHCCSTACPITSGSTLPSNVQARAGNGVQTDLSIRGTTFEQTLVLVNGFRLNDPESGHLNLDIPLPLEAISRIDVLHGSGSTFYGSDAIGGAVNLITAPPTAASVFTKAGFGSYGAEEQHLQADYTTKRLAEQFTGSRDTSNGFIQDRGYHANALASETWLRTKPGTTDVLLAG